MEKTTDQAHLTRWKGKRDKAEHQPEEGTELRCTAQLLHPIRTAVAGLSAARRAKVSGWGNLSTRKRLEEFTADSTEVYTLPGEAVKGDGICPAILPWRVLDVREKIWLQTERAALPFRQSRSGIWSTHYGLFYGLALRKFFPVPLLAKLWLSL